MLIPGAYVELRRYALSSAIAQVHIYYAPIAQLDRASAYGAGCCRFDSCWAHLLIMVKKHIFYMNEALKEAKKAFDKDEVPIGAVIVYKDKIIGRGYNQVETLKDPTAHAEIIAITSATNYLNTKWLNESTAYVTIEPCSMCAGAFVLSRIKNICFGARDPKTGACGSVVNIANHKKLNHRIKITKGILEKECASILKEFFSRKRS